MTVNELNTRIAETYKAVTRGIGTSEDTKEQFEVATGIALPEDFEGFTEENANYYAWYLAGGAGMNVGEDNGDASEVTPETQPEPEPEDEDDGDDED